jgi:pimeloyl-ACP methyl ester carboxylesterase
VAKLLATLHPAALDPRFLGRVIDPGYLTTLPGTRGGTFYHAPDTDPGVVRVDEATKETGTVPEAVGVFAMELPGLLGPVSQAVCATVPGLCDGVTSSVLYGITRDITVPVLDVVGQYDALLCGGATGPNRCADVGAVQQDESAYYTGIARRCLTVAELPDSGHDVNLELNAQSWFALANDWSRFTLQQTSADSGTPCWSGNGQAGVLLPS